MSENKEKDPKKKPWASYSQEAYQAFCERLVHFSSKAVNSNAKPSGVRLGRASVDLPYIAVSTFVPKAVPLDYMGDAAKNAKLFSQVNAVLTGTAAERFNSVPHDETDFIIDAMATLGSADLTDDLDCHLKQVIMPDNHGNDVCLTPLHAAGLSRAINQQEEKAIAELNANSSSSDDAEGQSPLKRLFRRAVMGYGGANPQNVGGLVRDMQRPLFFMPPREDISAKKVLSIHYKGIRYANFGLIDGYLNWYDEVADKKQTMVIRETEIQYLQKITVAALDKGDAAYNDLMARLDLLPTNGVNEPILVDERTDLVTTGLILKTKRNTEWRNAFAQALAKTIMVRRQLTSQLNNQDALRIQSIISKEVLS